VLRLPAWLTAEKMGAVASPRLLFDVTIIEGHNGSGVVRLRRTVLAASGVEALADALEAWQYNARQFESGAISIQVGQGWVQSGGYRNASGAVALLERNRDTRSFVLTEFDGSVLTFDTDASAWTYLQDHHYQSVDS
jgi:hypothetical protein